jgi:16S rRNA processing protein RimM
LSPLEDDLYAVGKIVKAFGIRGEVIVVPMTDAPDRFSSIRRVFIGREPASVKEARIDRVAVGSRGVKVKFELTDDRTAAEGMVGHLLFVRARDRIRPEHGAYFVHDLIGLSVVEQDGAVVGTLRDVLHLPAHDVYVVDAKGREVMIPAVKEFVRDVDLDAKTMTVRLIEGMKGNEGVEE